MKCKKGLILIVDDDPTASLTLKSLLIKDEHNIDIAENGLEALAYLEEKCPDVILLDVMMPNIDGFEVCTMIKSDKRFEAIPVILVTALDSKEELIRGLEAGADEFLTKPVNGPELRARVSSMIRIKHQYNEIQATLELREDLTHIIAKNMSDPLRSILVSLYFLRKNYDNCENFDSSGRANSETYNSIESQALKLYSFSNDLLMLTKIKEGKLLLNRTMVEIVDLIEEVRKNYSLLAEHKGIDFQIDIPCTDPREVYLDANMILRMLDNLISNALKFSPSGSKVTLKLEYPEGCSYLVKIMVLDEGNGLSEEDQQIIYEKFDISGIRRDRFKSKNISKLGLGLAFCKMVVEAHNGNITVKANKPKGSIFTVEF